MRIAVVRKVCWGTTRIYGNWLPVCGWDKEKRDRTRFSFGFWKFWEARAHRTGEKVDLVGWDKCVKDEQEDIQNYTWIQRAGLIFSGRMLCDKYDMWQKYQSRALNPNIGASHILVLATAFDYRILRFYRDKQHAQNYTWIQRAGLLFSARMLCDKCDMWQIYQSRALNPNISVTHILVFTTDSSYLILSFNEKNSMLRTTCGFNALRCYVCHKCFVISMIKWQKCQSRALNPNIAVTHILVLATASYYLIFRLRAHTQHIQNKTWIQRAAPIFLARKLCDKYDMWQKYQSRALNPNNYCCKALIALYFWRDKIRRRLLLCNPIAIVVYCGVYDVPVWQSERREKTHLPSFISIL